MTTDPLPQLIASFDQLAACMRPVAGFCASFHRELMEAGLDRSDATSMVNAFMRPFADNVWEQQE